MPFFIGDISPSEYDPSQAKHLKHSRETRTLSEGDIIEFFGYVGRWNRDCVTDEDCYRLQGQGDPSCDAALDLLFPKPSDSVGKDLYESLVSYCSRHEGPHAAAVFLEEVHQMPPPAIVISEEEVRRGREFFLDHTAQIMQALLYYSLAGGFASARIVRTLQAVSYLIPNHGATHISQASNDRTYSRLLETMQFFLDVIGCPPHPLEHPPNLPSPEKRPLPGSKAYLLPGGEGWKACVRVRMLHGVARRRARERLIKADALNAPDVPLSQEEMCATLGSFSVVPLWCITRVGLTPPAEGASAYLALWRHVGYYLGISPDILTRYFSCIATAEKFLATTILDLFSQDEPIDVRAIPTIPILRAVSNRPPSNASFAYNCAVSRYLVGSELADTLGLPPTSFQTALLMHTTFFVYKIPVWFAQWYPRKAWALKRREALSEGIARAVRFNLGMRRPQFRPRTDVQGQTSRADDRGLEDSSGSGGDLAEGVKGLEAVTLDYTGAQVLMRKWREMLVEIVIVHAVLGGVAVVLAAYVLRR